MSTPWTRMKPDGNNEQKDDQTSVRLLWLRCKQCASTVPTPGQNNAGRTNAHALKQAEQLTREFEGERRKVG